MADVVTSTTLLNGRRIITVRYTNESDGTGETAVKKFDHTAFGTDADIKILRIWSATQGMAVKILWDATTKVLAWNCPQDRADEIDFRPIGGLPNGSGSGVTGDIYFSTIGASAGDSYVIVLELVTD